MTGPSGVSLAAGVTVNGIDPSEVATGGSNLGSVGGVVTVVVEHKLNLSLMQVCLWCNWCLVLLVLVVSGV